MDAKRRDGRRRIRVTLAGSLTYSGQPVRSIISYPWALTVSISGTVSVRVSINSRLRRRPRYPPVSKPTESPKTNAGALKPGAPFDWFSGRNDLNLPVYDPTTGGCRDGLHPDRPNENQERNLRSLIFMRYSSCAWLKTLSNPLRPAHNE